MTPPPDFEFGEGYPGDLNQPSRLQVVMGIGPDNELVDIGPDGGAYVDRESVRIDRSNEDGANAVASYTLVLTGTSYYDIPAHRYVSIIDPLTDNGEGGKLAIFAGYTMNQSPKEEALQREIAVRCVDFGILTQKPPKQITTQWPPGDGTPVVNTMVAASIAAGTDVVVTPDSLRHLYVGKKVFAQNSDGSNKERIEVKTIDYDAGTFTADFTSSKTSTETLVQQSLHATGEQEIEPDSMANIGVGSVLYCKKNHGNQDVGNEFVVVSAVTATTFTARFTAWKTHDWTVRSQWQLVGGISDRELIADGFSMHLDSIDPDTGDPVVELVEIPSLIDYCYTDADVTMAMSKDAVEELQLSLPHGKWEGATPADVLNWVVAQNTDDSIKPRWYTSFTQPTVDTLVTLVPMIRYYDAYATPATAPITLTNENAVLDPATEARYSAYTYPEDGARFANKLTVLGALGAQGEWYDEDSVIDPVAPNFVGRIIEATPVRDNTLTTNEECTLRAQELAVELGHAVRQKSVSVTTFARIAPRILYEPHLLNFDAILEPDLPGVFEVKNVSLSYDSNGMAVWNISAGTPVRHWSTGAAHAPRNLRRANVTTDASGRPSGASAPVTRYINTHALVDAEADLYVGDPDDGELNLYLPPVSQNAGLPVTLKAPASATYPTTVWAYQRNGVLDTIDGLPSLTLIPGQSVVLQSAGEYDRTGFGGIWHVIGESGAAVAILALPLSINIPVSGGGSPVEAGDSVPVIVDFACTITAVRMILMDDTGDVSDTVEVNVNRTPFGSPGSTGALNPSAFGPSAASTYEDDTLSGWSTSLSAHDVLQVEVVTAPTVATLVGLALEVVRI